MSCIHRFLVSVSLEFNFSGRLPKKQENQLEKYEIQPCLAAPRAFFTDISVHSMISQAYKPLRICKERERKKIN